MGDSSEEKREDTTISDACTRSGAFALLLSVVLFLLIPSWLARYDEIAVRQYLSLRLNLSVRLEMLEQDPFWGKYKSNDPAAESYSISKLKDVNIDPFFKELTPSVQPDSKPTVPPVDEKVPGSPSRPNPPSNLRAALGFRKVGLNNIPEIADILKELNDGDILRRSREVSNYFEFSIVRWVTRRDNLIYRNVVMTDCTNRPIEAPHSTTRPIRFVPVIDVDVLMNCLTIKDALELSQYEFPAVINPPQMGEQVGRQIDLNPGTLPHDPYLASVLGEVLLFFVIMYFGAYGREAVSTPTFPAKGTLFGAFSNSRPATTVFFIALWIPLSASLGVAISSKKWELTICTAFIGYATVSAFNDLRRKKYFSSLNPSRLMNLYKNLTNRISPSKDSGS